jgi:hypothetical protein
MANGGEGIQKEKGPSVLGWGPLEVSCREQGEEYQNTARNWLQKGHMRKRSRGLRALGEELEGYEHCARPVQEAEAVRFCERMARRDEVDSCSRSGDGIGEVGQGRCFPLNGYTLLQPLDGEHRSPACRRYATRPVR